MTPVFSFGATSSSIACMIDGTPAMMMTLPIQKPGAPDTLLATRAAPIRNAGHAHARFVEFAAHLGKRSFMIATASG